MKKHRVQSQQALKKWRRWSLVSGHDVLVYYLQVTCRLKGQQWSLRFVPIYSDFTVETEISTMFWGSWWDLSKMEVTEIHASPENAKGGLSVIKTIVSGLAWHN